MVGCFIFLVFEKREATILSDYFIIAGAKWSILNKGETVTVLQELPTGYYLVKATRQTVVDVSTKVKRNISDSVLAAKCGDAPAPSSNHTMLDQKHENTRVRRVSQGTPTILIEQSSNGSLVPSDSFQSNISDDSGIVEGAKRTSNISGNNDDEDKMAAGNDVVSSDGSNGYLQSKIKSSENAMSLPRNFSSKLTTSSAGSDGISTSLSCGNFSVVGNKKEYVNLPLLGSVPPSILSCYADQLFHPIVNLIQTNPIPLQPPPVKVPTSATKKSKKQATRGNRLSLQVDSLSEDISPSRKASTLPHNGAVSPSMAKAERGRSPFKSFFKKRNSTNLDRSSSVSSAEGDPDKDHLSIQKEPTPVEIQRVQSPVYGKYVLINAHYAYLLP